MTDTELDFMTMPKLRAETYGARFDAYEKYLKTRKLEHELASFEGSNFGNRTITLPDITTYSVAAAIDSINRWRRIDPGCDIRIEINSPGGGVFSGLNLYDVLREASAQGHRIITCAYGYAASMAGILLQAGDERQISPNAFLMIHEVSSGAIGKWSEMVDEVEFVERLQKIALTILARRSTLSIAAIKRRSARKDWWLDAGEAVKFGFVDTIFDPDSLRVEVE